MTSHWLHGYCIPKIGCHYFWPGLIALHMNTLPNCLGLEMVILNFFLKNRNFILKCTFFSYFFIFLKKFMKFPKSAKKEKTSEIWVLKGLT
jgi:hypothetical protein